MRAALDLAGMKKGEVIPDSAAPISDFLFLSRNLGTWTEGMKTLLHEWSFPRNKSKNKGKSTTKVLPRKFNWKKIWPRILWKSTLKKTRNLMNFETLQENKKMKRKILKFKELCFLDTLSDEFPVNCTKNLQYFIFSTPFFLISLYKILWKNLYCLCYPFEPISKLETI